MSLLLRRLWREDVSREFRLEGALTAEECLRAGGFGLFVLLRMLLAREVLLRTLLFILPRVLWVREVLLRELLFILPRVLLV